MSKCWGRMDTYIKAPAILAVQPPQEFPLALRNLTSKRCFLGTDPKYILQKSDRLLLAHTVFQLLHRQLRRPDAGQHSPGKRPPGHAAEIIIDPFCHMTFHLLPVPGMPGLLLRNGKARAPFQH